MMYCEISPLFILLSSLETNLNVTSDLSSKSKRRWILWALLFCCAVLIWFVRPFLSGAHRQTTCQDNLSLIAEGLHKYHDEHGSFPPPFTMNEVGEPLHSWRVLILPFIGYQDLYDDLDLNLQWNHPDNIKHETRLPHVYRCPSFVPTKKLRKFMTSYVAIVGVNTVWQSSDYGIKMSDVVRPHDRTALLIESDEFGVHWMAPFDLSEKRLFELGADEAASPFFGAHNGESHILMVDGSLRATSDDLDLAEFRKMLSISSEPNK